MSLIHELTATDFRGAISARLRRRLAQGVFERGEDIQALRRFVGLSQANFASALGISVHTLRNWEQDRRKPEGPANRVAADRCAPSSDHSRERRFGGVRRPEGSSPRAEPGGAVCPGQRCAG